MRLGISSALLAVMLATSLVGCSAARSDSSSGPSGAVATETPSPVPLDADGKGELKGVSVGPSETPLTYAPGSPEDRAQERYGHSVDVGVFGSIQGVQTKLVIPMWYGESATYELTAPSGGGVISPPTSLVDAAATKDGVVWWGGSAASIKYHFEDGYFVLDELISPAPH
ncbi:MAG: hypothetical protein U1E22_08780 [Coriobacteriia bacterium]|nr:hypothetical protein [Coriobacteriia bacterium]